MKSNSLQDALKFTDADLKANRAGHLSTSQLKRFQHEKLKFERRAKLIITLGSIFLIGFGVFQMISGDLTRHDYYFAGLIFCFLWLGWYIMRKASHELEAIIESQEVETVQGQLWRLKKRPQSNSLNHHYYVGIGNDGFFVSKHVYQLFNEEAVYNIYYTAKEKTILAAEMLSH